MGQLLAQIVQCCIAIAIGAAVFYWLQDEPNPKVPLFGALFCGIFGSWLVMKLYVFIRHGWKAMRSMSIDP